MNTEIHVNEFIYLSMLDKHIREYMSMKENWNNGRIKTKIPKELLKTIDTSFIISSSTYIIVYHHLYDNHHGMRSPSAKKEPDL